MPFITLPAKPSEWPQGRTATGASYHDDTGLAWVAEVDALERGDTEITKQQYQDQVAANIAHNEAIPVHVPAPEPPVRNARLRTAVTAATTLPQLKAALTEWLDAR